MRVSLWFVGQFALSWPSINRAEEERLVQKGTRDERAPRIKAQKEGLVLGHERRGSYKWPREGKLM
jgi:hypothetical protein